MCAIECDGGVHVYRVQKPLALERYEKISIETCLHFKKIIFSFLNPTTKTLNIFSSLDYFLSHGYKYYLFFSLQLFLERTNERP